MSVATVALAGLAALGGLLPAALHHHRAALPDLDYGVVDTHVHLMTTDNGIHYTWTVDPSKLDPPEACPCRPPCACNMSVPEYEHATNSTRAVIIFCEVSVEHQDWLLEAQWVQGVAEAYNPRSDMPHVGAILAQPPPLFGIAPVAAYSPELDTLSETVPLLRGFRAALVYQAGNGTSRDALVAGLDEVGRRGLVVDYMTPPVTDPMGAEVVRLTPNTTYIVEHLGCGCNTTALATNASALAAWRAGVHAVAQLSNVACLQLGGTMAAFATQAAVDPEMIRPLVAAAVEEFGFDRLCFESNWFFSNWRPSEHWDQGYGTWLALLRGMLADAGATDADVRKVLRDNALRIYGVDAPLS
jgi:predicted TIM-barrel fold metal-dependent hydrolase